MGRGDVDPCEALVGEPADEHITKAPKKKARCRTHGKRSARKSGTNGCRLVTSLRVSAELAPFSSENTELVKRLFRDQGKKHWAGYALAIGMTFIIAWTTSMSAWIMRDVINHIFVDRSLRAVWIIGGVIAVIYIVKGFASYAQTAILARVANSIVADIRKGIFEKMLKMSVGYYNVRHSTEFIARQAFISQSASGALICLSTCWRRIC